MRRVWIVILIIAVLAGLGWLGYRQANKAKAAAQPDFETVTVSRGDIAATVSATGEVLGEREADLTYQSAGTIANVAVEVGDVVTPGQLLAQLDTTDLELAVRQAAIGLRTAQAQRRQLDEKPSSGDVAAAQAALASAQAAYQQLLEGSDADQLAAARASVEQARVAMEQAQQAYDQIKDMSNAGMMPQALQLQQATIAYETAQAQYRVTARAANRAQRAAAQAQVAQAQANLDRLLKPTSAEQVEIAQAGVDQAEVTLAQAQRRLDNSRITAPWAGVVTGVNMVEGTQAQPGAPAVHLADTSQFHIDVKVDEVDIAGVIEGQPVVIEVDALPDQKLTGKVQKVSPTAVINPTGGTTYQVRIDIDPTDAPLRAGMSATATITSNQRNDVLLVPNRAISRERDTGKTFVERLANGVPQKVEVRLGLSDDQQSEVREGLNDGDQLVIRNRSSLERLQQSFGGGS
jgi:HlyD family secretion protein